MVSYNALLYELLIIMIKMLWTVDFRTYGTSYLNVVMWYTIGSLHMVFNFEYWPDSYWCSLVLLPVWLSSLCWLTWLALDRDHLHNLDEWIAKLLLWHFWMHLLETKPPTTDATVDSGYGFGARTNNKRIWRKQRVCHFKYLVKVGQRIFRIRFR